MDRIGGDETYQGYMCKRILKLASYSLSGVHMLVHCVCAASGDLNESD